FASVMLVLLAWTSLAGAVLAGAVACSLALMWWRDRSRVARGALACAVATVISCGLAALVCIPPGDFHSFSPGIPNSSGAYFETDRILTALGGTWRGLFPVPAAVGGWNSNVLDRFSGVLWLQAVVSLALVIVVARVLRPFRVAFSLWIIGTIAYVGFSIVVVLPNQAHYAGEFLLLFVACAWLAYAPPCGAPAAFDGWKRGLPAVLVVVLLAQIVATLAILPDATMRPFAPDRTIAQAAQRTGLARDVVSGQDFDASTVSGYL